MLGTIMLLLLVAPHIHHICLLEHVYSIVYCWLRAAGGREFLPAVALEPVVETLLQLLHGEPESCCARVGCVRMGEVSLRLPLGKAYAKWRIPFSFGREDLLLCY